MRTLLAASAATFIACTPALAQETGETTVDRVTVDSDRSTLTVADTRRATDEIQRIAGGVSLIPDTAFRNGPAATIKDVLGNVPGVVVQSRWGPDGRLSIRGSGLSRNYGNRGINVFMDGVPINTSDGLFDLFEIDPSAYRYVEVYKGANALRYGGNSLGGAINFVTPTGHVAQRPEARLDVGSFGAVRGQANVGGVRGLLDWYATVSAQAEDGFRDHSRGHVERLSANVGYRLSPKVETRVYLNANTWRGRIPGELTKAVALATPTAANPGWVVQDQQRNIDSVRLANKTTWQSGPTRVDLGLFGVYRHVMHPIFQYLDFTVEDYGAFARVTDERPWGGLDNRLIAGLNIHNGAIDTEQFVNLPGAVKGALAASMVDRSRNLSAYAEDSLRLQPDLTVIAGVQFQHAERDRRDRFPANGDQSGGRSYDLWSPKLGLLWDVDADWQVFANVSRSAEAPSFDANSFASPANSSLKAQTAITWEVGTRGQRGGISWEVSLYRANLRNELQCLTTGPFSACSIINADRTVHQGVEAGLVAPVARSVLADGDRVVLTAAYTLNDFAFDGDAAWGDNRLPGVPRHNVRAEVMYHHPSGFYVGPGIEWAPGRYFADNANSVAIDPYALLNLRAGFDARGGWSAYVEARNLTDEHYLSSVAIAGIATPASEIFNPGYGRSVHAGLRVRW